MSTTSSRNFTTLYSGSGSVVPQGAYGNANVVSLLNVGTDGANTVANIVATGNITADYFIGDGSQLTNITAGNISGNVNFANTAGTAQFVTGNAQANITSVGTLTSLSVTGNVTGGNLITAGAVSATGNVTGNYIIGNGSQLTGLPEIYGNANVAANLAAFGSNPISTSGNITAGYFFGNGSGLTNINAGNIVGAYGNANVAANLAVFATNPISTSGNITAGYFFGNGSGLTDINAANIVGAYGNANVSNFLANGFGSNTITTIGNITSGNLVTAGNLFGNVVGATFRGVGTANVTIQQFGNIGDGSALNLKANLVVVGAGSGGSNACTIVSPPGAGLELAASGDVGGGGYIKLDELGNVQITGYQSGQNGKGVNLYGNTHIGVTVPAGIGTTTSQGNLIVANAVYVGESISATGNITGGNLRTAGAVSATGNINGGNVIVPVNGKYYGDFTTGTTAGRTVFQTTATGTSAATSLTAVPGPNHITSNTAFSSQINLFANGTDLGNSAFGRMQMFGNRLNFEVLAAGSGPVGNMRFAAGSGQMVFLNTGSVGIGNANPNHSFSTNETFIAGNISVTGNVITNKFLQAQGYTAAALNAITGSTGQMAAVTDSAGGGNPNGMLAFWDTTNARWSYIHDNTAV